MPPSQWQCSLCSSQFSRAEHLRRHLRSHENKRPYKCSLCERPFTRRDAKTRHEKICKARPGSGLRLEDVTPADTAPALTAGHQLCNEVEDHMAMSMPYSLDFAALDWLYSTRMSSDSIITAERLDFLAHFTSENGMGTFLAPETLAQRQDMIVQHEITSQPSLMANAPQTIEPSMLQISSDSVDPLLTRTFEILHHFHSIITQKRDRNVVTLVWSPEIEDLCRSFFSPPNITRFLGYFWSLWYPNCPIIHRASFDPLITSPALLCVMLIIGACLSPHSNDARTARIWLDCAEELAFENDSFHEYTGVDALSGASEQCMEQKRKQLEDLQTAYLVCSLQKREGSIAARARIRRYRHATMVMLARDIGLATATHRNLALESCSETWWHQFAVEEGLIRTMTYVFLFDAALTIFHNSPPRMVVSELKMDLACPEACFQAQSAKECFDVLKQWESTVFWKRHLSIVAAVKSICQKELVPETIEEYSKVGSLNLFTAVQSLHSLTFHLQNSIIFESTLLPIRTGLENWRRIWEKHEAEDKFISDSVGTLWKKVGFMGYSAEFWHLARIIVDNIDDENGDSEDLGESSIDIADQTKSRYDHTDMTGVNGLIMEYRRMSLGAIG
ncbi:hypothetical protein BDV18DRAFT_160164 [Aspergillus unguis]